MAGTRSATLGVVVPAHTQANEKIADGVPLKPCASTGMTCQ